MTQDPRKNSPQASDMHAQPVAWGVTNPDFPGNSPGNLVVFQGREGEENAKHYASLGEGRQALPLVFGSPNGPEMDASETTQAQEEPEPDTVDGWKLKIRDGEVWAEKGSVSMWVSSLANKPKSGPR